MNYEINKNLKISGFHLEKNFTRVNSLFSEIKNIFECYTSSKFSYQLLFDLFENDFDGFLGCANACQNSIPIINFATSTKMMNILRLSGLSHPILNTRPLISFSSSRLSKSQNNWLIPPHQDWHSTQGSLNGLTCWMPLIDVDINLGPLEVIPKSHILGAFDFVNKDGVNILKDDYEKRLNKDYKYEPIVMNAGDMLIFSWFLIHKSGLNCTKDRIRISIHMRYDDLSESSFKLRKYPKCRKDVCKEYSLPIGWPDASLMRNLYEQ